MKIRPIILLLFVAAALGPLTLMAQAAPSALPPRPTPLPLPTATQPALPPQAPAPRGAFILLRVTSAQAESWTVVQWQDPFGAWYDVQGWQGTFDTLQSGVGEKLWWVAGENLGEGPFRWQVYAHVGGPTVATSDPFDLPATAGQKATVDVMMAP